ncbi:MAG: alpha/beta hydrolase [Deltaproteobacteria bacterium]|nr:MAG: alpha/beta hydrolase [Deltaproteobacteria bacterium]
MLDDVTRRRLALPERGVEIALLDWGGAGPLALLHHANGFCAATLDLVARPLRAHFRVIGMDARGHGDSSRPNGENAYAWREFGADLAAVARVLAAEHGGRIALGLGHSFGGTSMLLAAAEEPALFERLVLVDPVLHEPHDAHHYDADRHLRASEMVERATRRRAVFPDRAAARESWRDKDMFADWVPRAFDLYLAEALGDRSDGQVELKCSPETEAAVYGAGFTSNVWDPTEQLAVPALILWAQRGNFPRSVFEAYAKHFGNARILDMDAGHLMAMVHPELVDRKSALRPAGPALRHRHDVREAHLHERPSRECAAVTAAAVEHDRARAVREPRVALVVLEVGAHLEEAARRIARAWQMARRELVGLAHVDEVPALAAGRREAPQRLLGRDHLDVLQRFADEVGERARGPHGGHGRRRLHRRKALRLGGRMASEPRRGRTRS